MFVLLLGRCVHVSSSSDNYAAHAWEMMLCHDVVSMSRGLCCLAFVYITKSSNIYFSTDGDDFMTEKHFSSSSLFLGNLWWKFDDTCRLYDEQKLQKLTHLVLFCLHSARWKGSSGRGKLYESSETCAHCAFAWQSVVSCHCPQNTNSSFLLVESFRCALLKVLVIVNNLLYFDSI